MLLKKVVVRFLLGVSALILALSVPQIVQATECSAGPGKDLTGCDFTGQNLGSVNLSSSNLSGVNLEGANLGSVNLSLVRSGAVTGTPASLPVGWSLKSGYLVGPTAVLDSANFAGVDLTNADLSNSSLINADLSLADLSQANLTNANLDGANLQGSNLYKATVSGATLTGANLKFLKSGSLVGIVSSTPAEWFQSGGFLLGPEVVVTNTSISSTDLKNRNLQGSDFSGTVIYGSLDGTNLSDSNLSNAILRGCGSANSTNFSGANMRNFYANPEYLFGVRLVCGYSAKTANFSGADLTDASLQNIDLTSANFSSANVAGLNVFGTASYLKLVNVESGSLSGTPLAFSGWKVISGHLVGPGANLTGADLSNQNLASLNLTGTNFSKANLTWTSLIGANLTNANLANATVSNTYFANSTLTGLKTSSLQGLPSTLPSGWVLWNGFLLGTGADLSNQEFRNLDLTGVNLTSVTLTGVRSSGLAGTPTALPQGWKVVSGYLVGPGADLTGSDFTNANLSGVALTGTNLTDVKLEGVTSGAITGTPLNLPSDWKLLGGYLVGPTANLAGAALGNVSLSSANLTGVTSGSITGSPSALPTGWKLVNGYLVGPTANLTNANLTNAVLTGATLSDAKLAGATLSGVVSGTVTGTPSSLPAEWQLAGGYLIGPGANLTNAKLQNFNLAGQNLQGTKLTGAALTGLKSGGVQGAPASLPTGWKLVGGYLIGSGANLSGANLQNLNLAGVTLTNCILENSRSGGIQGTPSAMASGWKLVGGYLLGDKADLSGSDLSNLNLNGVYLTSANLEGVRSGGITSIPNSLPAGWKLVGGYLIGPKANLSNADLTNRDLRGVDLTGANMQGAILKGVRSARVIGFPLNLNPDFEIRGGFILGPEVTLSTEALNDLDLSNLNLTGANLFGSWLQGAQLDGTRLDGAVLDSVRSGAISGTPAALPAKWRMVNGYLVGPSANLSDAKLQGQDLSNMDLKLVNFTGADLTNVVFDSSDLEQSNFKNAVLTGAKLRDVNLNFSQCAGAVVDANISGYGWSVVNGNFFRLFSSTPEITLVGNAEVDKELKIEYGTWSPEPATVTFLWLVDGVAVEGQTQQNLQLSSAFFGKEITAKVIAALPRYATTEATSSPVRVTEGQLISGEATASGLYKVGTKVSANAEGWQPGVTFTYQWLRDGAAIPGASSADYMLTSTDLGKKLAVVVTGMKVGYQKRQVSSVASLVSAGELSQSSVPQIVGKMFVGKDLAVDPGVWDTGTILAYQWLRNGAPISEATATTYKLTSADIGQSISVRLTGSKQGYVSVSKTSHAITASKGEMENIPTPTISGVAKVDQMLTAQTGVWPSGSRITYQWLKNGQALDGQTQMTYLLTASDVAAKISIRVTGSLEGFSDATKTSIEVTVSEGVLKNSPTPALTGTFSTGKTVAVSPGQWDTDVKLSFQWLRNGVPIPKAQQSTYTLTGADYAKTISVAVTGSKLGFSPVTVSSTGNTVSSSTMSSSAPKITGVAKVGSTLKVAVQRATPKALISYQWLQDGKLIKGATGSTFKVPSTLKGKKVSVRVTQSETGYLSITQTTAAIKIG